MFVWPVFLIKDLRYVYFLDISYLKYFTRMRNVVKFRIGLMATADGVPYIFIFFGQEFYIFC